MKIVMIGDSLTDMGRDRSKPDFNVHAYGMGFVFYSEAELELQYPNEYQIYNRGIGGERVVDLYLRIKEECWRYNPDIVSVLVGVNDALSEDSVELDRYDAVYRLLVKHTKQKCSNVQIILVEPFIAPDNENYALIRRYADVVRKIAQDYDCIFVPVQEKINAYCKDYGRGFILHDGIHTSVLGAKILANEWLMALRKTRELQKGKEK